MNPDDLRRSPLLQGLSDSELQQLMDGAEPAALRAGEALMQQGDVGHSAYVVLEGRFEISKQSGRSVIKIDERGPGDLIGEMALLSHIPRSASVTALSDSRVLRLPRRAFEDLIASSPSATLAVLHWVIARLNQNEALLHQHEKAAALGTLSAGLAHELNNPSAAVQRSAAQLDAILPRWLDLTSQAEEMATAEGCTHWLQTVMNQIRVDGGRPANLDALERIEGVERIQGWLETNGIEAAWEYAPALAEYGWSDARLAELKRNSTAPAALFELVLQWLGTDCLAKSLLAEVQDGTARISQIVRAMKSYTYLDQAPVLEVDVHEGLESTLVIMQHKLQPGVTVKREYAPGLPRIEAFASELNQVWTNLIDNAIDAMSGRGVLTLRTYEQDERVVVEIEDDGPGMPEAVQRRVFEPFYTTKAPGSGTGLGLYISHDIIANRHSGQIALDSRPGKTIFRVILPKHLKGPDNDAH